MATRKKEGTDTSNPSTKRKPSNKNDHLPKKPKMVKELVVAIPTEGKLPPTPIHGRGKGLMMGQVPGDEKRPIILHKDPQYALKQLLSILTSEDYMDLGNHSIEAIRETGLFSLAQVCFYPPFLSIMLFVY